MARAARAREMALFVPLYVTSGEGGPRCLCALSITLCWKEKNSAYHEFFYFIFQEISNFL